MLVTVLPQCELYYFKKKQRILSRKREDKQTEERIAGRPFWPLASCTWLACPLLASWSRKAVEPGEERKTTNGKNSGEWWRSLRACNTNVGSKISITSVLVIEHFAGKSIFVKACNLLYSISGFSILEMYLIIEHNDFNLSGFGIKGNRFNNGMHLSISFEVFSFEFDFPLNINLWKH